MKQRSYISGAATLAVVITLSACGGGGGEDIIEESPTAPAPAPAPSPAVLDPGFVIDSTTRKIILYSAKGDLQRYRGKWESGCISAVTQPFNRTRSFINVYQLTDAQNTTVQGKFTQFQFTDAGCTMKSSPAKVDMDVSLSGIREEATSSRASSYTGFLDSMQSQYTGLTFFERPDFMAFSQGYQYLLIGQQRGLLVSNLFDGVVYAKK